MARDKRISVRGRRRQDVDIKRLSRALLAVAAQQAADEAAAQAEYQQGRRRGDLGAAGQESNHG